VDTQTNFVDLQEWSEHDAERENHMAVTDSQTLLRLRREESLAEQQGRQASNIAAILKDFPQYEAARLKADALLAKASALREQIVKIETLWPGLLVSSVETILLSKFEADTPTHRLVAGPGKETTLAATIQRVLDHIRSLDYPMDEARVQKIANIKQALADGTYNVIAEEVARKIIDHRQEPWRAGGNEPLLDLGFSSDRFSPLDAF
jgi:anti-sigma28 factor (negative regulator of flagellin synthesis)